MVIKRENIEYPADPLWKGAVELIRRLQGEGHAAYMVGGCVRELLLGGKPHEYDIAASCRPEETLRLFPGAGRTGMKYGVLGVRSGGFTYQVAVFRRDHPESDGRRPREIFFSDLQGDAERRDFTVNAIYLDPIKLEFLDPQGGMADIEKRLLRFIGDPDQRIQHDHLRLLRAVRFASRCNFQLEPAAFSAVKRLANLVDKISPDRIREELTRCFLEGNPLYALDLLHLSGILAILWDIFKQGGEEFFLQVKASLGKCSENAAEAVWSAFFAPWRKLEQPAKALEAAMLRLNFPRRWKKAVKDRVLQGES